MLQSESGSVHEFIVPQSLSHWRDPVPISIRSPNKSYSTTSGTQGCGCIKVKGGKVDWTIDNPPSQKEK